MGRAFVYILTLAFVGLFAFLTVGVLLRDGVTVVVVAALVVLVLVIFGALGAIGGRNERRRR
ncbi:MAG: hypothetical protein AVDCRST_MAG45-1801 [uncultured Solirubrobacterales bacterium]|uniref:Uncharacterized protein n=1 Tax=uncultured Solirubrobacterales bacterium TaxID=768556 RepID=A0A6J4SZP0_9ACTN|nr:MAG: hypothetical protein AVDCRST_MAG45-1801 [uncultured Solirubrobacterales bacterium]